MKKPKDYPEHKTRHYTLMRLAHRDVDAMVYGAIGHGGFTVGLIRYLCRLDSNIRWAASEMGMDTHMSVDSDDFPELICNDTYGTKRVRKVVRRIIRDFGEFLGYSLITKSKSERVNFRETVREIIKLAMQIDAMLETEIA